VKVNFSMAVPDITIDRDGSRSKQNDLFVPNLVLSIILTMPRAFIIRTFAGST
jgi:hypothetical protein